jgi:outer membrane autotransporter protein
LRSPIRLILTYQLRNEGIMKIKTYLKLTSSLVAVGAAFTGAPALAQMANGWTGGSSYHETCTNDGGATYYNCDKDGDNQWSNNLNWSNGLPTASQDISIGLSTYESGTYERPTQRDTVVISNVTNAEAGQIKIGFDGARTDSGSAGSGTLTNEGSLTVGNGIVVGSSGTGTLVNNGNLDVTNGSLVIGRGGQGSVTIGQDATTDIGQHLVVGESNAGELVSNSDVIVGGSTTIGQLTNGNGNLTLQNGADLTTDGNLTVGELGLGQLFVGSGSVVETDGTVGAGLGSTSTGNLISIDGSMLNHKTFTLGQNGEAALAIGENGRVETDGRVTLGVESQSLGVVVNNGTMVNGQQLVVGEQGRGFIETYGPDASTTTQGNVTLGAEDGGVGVVAVTNDGAMNNTGRLHVGDEGQGYLLVSSGGEVNNTVGVIGREDTSRGYALATGEGSLWDNRTSLTLANEENSQGLLVINEDATVRIDGGEGTLFIAAEDGSTGVLNIGALSPIGEDYGIDPEVSDAFDLENLVTDDTARGAGTLDAAFVKFGDGEGTVNFKTTETEADDYRFKAGFVGKGTINHYAGFTVLDGDSSGFTGEANVIGGTLVANNVLAGDVTVGENGALRIGHGGETGDVVNDIANDGLVEFNRSNTYVFDSVISGNGDVAQIGSGTTVITATNTYTGATTINNGTLQLGDGGETGSIGATSGVAIGEDGTLAFNRSDDVVWDRLLSGDGTIRQIGTGKTTITEDNSSFIGETYVDAGTLSVNGILGGTVDVNDGGTLAGIGQVGTTVVHDGGTISPGNSIGTLTVAGDLRQLAGSTYQAEVLSTGESDLIHVTGEANIDPDAILNVTKLDSDRYDLDRRYRVLTADEGVTGDYILTGDTFVSTFYRVEDHYDDNNVYLKVNQYRQLQEAGLTRNQIAAATAAQELKGQVDDIPGYETTGRPTNELFRALAYLPTEGDAQYAFDQISGEIYASTTIGLLEQSRFVRDATGQRIRDAFGGVGAKKDADDSNGLSIWGQGFGAWSEVDGDGNAGAFSNNIGGFFVGADMPVTEDFRVGVLGGYSRSSFSSDGRGSSASSDNFDLGIYGGGKIDNFGFRLGGNYTWHSISTDRNVNFPGFSESLNSDYDARTAQIYGDIGYTIDMGGAQFEPFAGLAYVDVDRDGYSESGGVAALSGDSDNVNATFSTLGLRASTTFDAGGLAVKATGMLGWRHAFDGVTPTATHSFAGSSPFTVAGVPLAENVAVVELGLETLVSQDLTLGVSYSGQFGSGFNDHGLKGNLNWKF